MKRSAISHVAAKLHCSVVVLGAISRSGWQRLIIGNTADTLQDRLPCDLLIVKPQRFKTRVPHRLSGARFIPTADVIIG